MNAQTQQTRINPTLARRLQAKKTYAEKYLGQDRCDWRKARSVGKNPHIVGPKDNEAVAGRGVSTATGERFYTWIGLVEGSCYWQFRGYADELKPRAIRHTGGFTDEYQDGTQRGAVWTMRTARGMLIVPGYEEAKSGQAVVFFNDAELCGKIPEYDYDGDRYADAAADMAILADGLAKADAEKARLANAAYDKEWEARELYEIDYAGLRREVRGCLDKIRAHRSGLAEALEKQVEMFPMPDRPPEYAAMMKRRMAAAFNLKSREADLRDELGRLMERRAEIHAKAGKLREEARSLSRMAEG